MTYRNIKYIKPSVISVERQDGSLLVVDKSDSPEMWSEVSSGAWGEVEAYVSPPPPSFETVLSEWRKSAVTDMLALQDCIIDQKMFTKAEALSKGAGPKWRIRWQARGGIGVRRSSPELAAYAKALLAECGRDVDEQDWLDGLNVWRPVMPQKTGDNE